MLTRAARSARLTTHYDLDFPRAPARRPYLCHKHKRTCKPVAEAAKFLRRYTDDSLRRFADYAAVRTNGDTSVLHADARHVQLPQQADGVITSPPYPGLIDYHEQHRYAYELLDLVDRRGEEIGAAQAGRTRVARATYSNSMVDVFANTRRQLVGGAPVVIVVNDSLDLYPAKRNPAFQLDRPITEEKVSENYNNFYEFGGTKGIYWLAQRLQIRPWTVKVGGLVNKPREFDIDDLIRAMPIEERLYRFRCVEAWAMAVPWTGFPFSALIKAVEPKSGAKYVKLTTEGGAGPAPALVSLAVCRGSDH